MSATGDGRQGNPDRVELADGSVETWLFSNTSQDVQGSVVLHVCYEDGQAHHRIARSETQRRTQHAQAELSKLRASSLNE